MKKIIKYSMVVLGLTAMGGCKKGLEVQNPSAYTAGTYFTNDQSINQAVIGAYAPLLHIGMWAREYYFIFDMLGWDAKPDAPLQGDLLSISQMTFEPSVYYISEQWKSLYRMVYRANLVVESANAWQPASNQEKINKEQYLGEAKFLRAYAYFNLVNNWGKVPLHTSIKETSENPLATRASTAEIWALIVNDLKEAQDGLPVSYPAQWLGRVTKGAATALLGKSYLYQKKWSEAQAELTKLTIAPFSYTLSTNYTDLFNENNQSNPETIFQIMNKPYQPGDRDDYFEENQERGVAGLGTHTARAQEYGWNDWANVFVTNAVVKSFTYNNPETGTAGYTDPRAKFTFYGDATSGGETQYCQQCAGGAVDYPFSTRGYRWLKYEYYDKVAKIGGTKSGINGQVIRYADVLLMLAETYIQQGNTSSTPLALINQVRARVGAVPYTSLGSQTTAFDLLQRERRLELSGEQSRYFDLIRWGTAKQTINAERAAEGESHLFQDRNVLFPIPQFEKDTNPNVANDVQNDWN
jgi:starch-binding outer membrane protein, SusD/RagB family